MAGGFTLGCRWIRCGCSECCVEKGLEALPWTWGQGCFNWVVLSTVETGSGGEWCSVRIVCYLCIYT